MEWRLLQMERGLAERDRLREENRRLEKTRRQHLANEQQFEEMKEELLRLQLHNHQVQAHAVVLTLLSYTFSQGVLVCVSIYDVSKLFECSSLVECADAALLLSFDL